MNSRTAVLVIGDLQRPEFAAAWSDDLLPADISVAENPARAAAQLAAGAVTPELIVIAQSWPGQFDNAAIDDLRRLAPLARLWTLAGSWCEGEPRTGRPLPGSTRAYWHQWASRYARELDRIDQGLCPSWGLPVTVSADERLLATAVGPHRDLKSAGLVVVCADNRETSDALADACRCIGYSIVTATGGASFSANLALAVVWDTTVEAVVDGQCVAHLRQASGGAPVIAVLGFPRREDWAAALAAGVSAVVSKPFLLGDLEWQLQRLAKPSVVEPCGPPQPST